MVWRKSAAASTAASPAASRRAEWWRLTQRWRMLGVFEIDPEHEFYQLTTTIQEGMQALIQNGVDTPAEETLMDDHYKAKESHTNQGFEIQTFAAPVFAKLRHLLSITEEEYMNSLCRGHYLQFISNSKSKADFFVTNDKRFFLKTQSRREVKFLLSNLKAYAKHLENYPHSLMVRFLGVHRIVIPNEKKKYFIVMQSVFYPDERINIRYDVKGCEVGRWTNPDTGGKQIIKVLKDNNFEGQFIMLGEEKSWFAEQVKLDVTFLQGLNVLDYSLLLAHQPLHQDERDGKQSLADIVVRATKSLDMDGNCAESQPNTVPLLEEGDQEPGAAAAKDGSGGRPAAAVGDEIPLEEMDSNSKETRSDSVLREFRHHHHRLLPNCKNSVHVIDGPDKRYFVGIIDIFTVYNWKKKLENVWKSVRYPGRAFSTIRPRKYSSRFRKWIQDHTK